MEVVVVVVVEVEEEEEEGSGERGGEGIMKAALAAAA